MGKKLVIPDGANILFEICGIGNPHIFTTARLYGDMEIMRNTLLMIDGALYCTDSINPVEHIKGADFKVRVWIQDAYVIQDGWLYKSVNDVD